ncbi:MAG: T9SS type A sorting domain-containing protein [Bacteroidetes bacterium]|nr:MAG: T9SS type A sorting domain-containing protein [Bacteroidota bacterium]
MKKLLLGLAMLLLGSDAMAQKIGLGPWKSFVICTDSTVYGFGNVGKARNDDYFYTERLPIEIPISKDVDTIVGTRFMTFFLKKGGTVWFTRQSNMHNTNFAGVSETFVPVQIPNLTDVTYIGAWDEAENKILFVKSDGTVWTVLPNAASATQVQGISNVSKVMVEPRTTYYIKNDGSVWVTGFNDDKRFGDNYPNQINTPTQIQGLSNIVSVASNEYYTLFLTSQGQVYTCGRLNYGMGDLSLRKGPTLMTSIDNVKTISQFIWGDFFLKNDGTLHYIGDNGEYGPLSNLFNGYFDPADVAKEVIWTPVQSTFNNIQTLISDRYHFLFIRNDSTIWACGDNQLGQVGIGSGAEFVNTLKQVTQLCYNGLPPAPEVDYSEFPSSLCLGGNINKFPNVSGSVPALSYSVDSGVAITAPKAICKNTNSVFILNSNDQILRYGSDGSHLYTYNLNSAITNISAITADDSNIVYADNGTGYLHRFMPTGMVDNVQSFWISTPQADMVYIPTDYLDEDIVVLEAGTNNLTGIDQSNSDAFSNSNPVGSFGNLSSVMSSITLLHAKNAEPVLLGTDISNHTIWSRKLFDASGTNGTEDKLFIDSNLTQSLEIDFVDADTLHDRVLFTSSSKAGLYYGEYFINNAGEKEFYFSPENLGAQFNLEKPIGAVLLNHGNSPTFWVADQAKNKLIRFNAYVYQVFPQLPEGLKFNVLTGKIDGTPTQIMNAQTYAIVVSDISGSSYDTSYFTFSVTPTNRVSDNLGSEKVSADVDDGKVVRYYSENSCEKLIDIADSIGGGSPGKVTVNQTVLPTIAVFKNTEFLRRTTEIRADRKDSVKAFIKIFYTYQDIALFNQSKGSQVLSNDTSGGTMQVAVLQMHDKPDGLYEPIKHSPLTAKWSSIDQHWEVEVPVTKFSTFYAGTSADVESFTCSDTSSFSIITSNTTYTWGSVTYDTSGVYERLFVNSSGCDSTVTMYLTINGTSNAITPMLDGAVKIFPNPSSDVFHLTCTDPNVQVRSIVVYNAVGAVVYSSDKMENGTHDIQLGNELKGLYFVHVRSNAEHIVRPIVLK